MNIIVCVKIMNKAASDAADQNQLLFNIDNLKNIVNPCDLNAVEVALKIREQVGGTVSLVSMGHKKNQNDLRYFYSLGVDNIFLLSDKLLAGSDTFSTSYALSELVKHVGQCDILLCGTHSLDGETGQVGPGIASMLGWEQITNVSDILNVDRNKIVVKKETEIENLELEVNYPVLMTITRSKSRRYLPNLKLANKGWVQSIDVFSVNDLKLDSNRIGLHGSPTKVIKVFSSNVSTTCELLDKVEQWGGHFNKILRSRINGVR